MKDGHMQKKKGKKRKKRKKKKRIKSQKGKQRKKNSGKHGRKEKMRERNLSLRSMKIGPSVFIRARDKVGPRNEGYAWVPKSWSFFKLHEV